MADPYTNIDALKMVPPNLEGPAPVRDEEEWPEVGDPYQMPAGIDTGPDPVEEVTDYREEEEKSYADPQQVDKVVQPPQDDLPEDEGPKYDHTFKFEDGTELVVEGIPIEVGYNQLVQDLKDRGQLPPDMIVGSQEKGMQALPSGYSSQARRLFLQGLSTGTADELAALLVSGLVWGKKWAFGDSEWDDTSFAQVYNDVLESERYQVRQYREYEPGKALTWEVAGGLTLGLASGGATAPISAWRTAGYGALWGAGYGFSGADPDTELSAVDQVLARAGEATKMGIVGAAGGFVLHGVGSQFTKVVNKRQRKKVMKEMKTREGREAVADRIEAEILKQQASGNSVHAMRDAIYKEGITQREAFSLVRERGKSFNISRDPQQAKDWLVANALIKKSRVTMGQTPYIDALIRPLHDVIGAVDPLVANSLRVYEANAFRVAHQWHEEAADFIGLLRGTSGIRMGANRKRALKIALSTQNADEVEKIMSNSFGEAGRAAWARVSAMLAQVRERSIKEGAPIADWEAAIFPRRVKDYEGLRVQMKLNPKNKGFEKYVEKYGDTERAFEAMVMAKAKGSKVKVGSQLRRQVTDEDFAEYMDHYHDPVAALDLFLREQSEELARRKFFGNSYVKDPKKKGMYDIDRSIDKLGERLLHLPEAERNVVLQALRTRFTGGEEGMGKWAANARSLAHNMLLANFESATTQLADVGVAMWMNGSMNVLRHFLGRKKVTADDLGIMRELMAELSDPGSINRWTDRLFKLSGFRSVDRLGKNAYIGSNLIKHQRMARSYQGRVRLNNMLREKWGTETDGLIKELRDGDITDRVKQFLFTELAETQPIARSEMPAIFLKMPNGRIFYQLMTWTMKQFNLVRKNVLRDLVKGDAGQKTAALKSYLRMVILLGGANVTTDELKRFMSGKQSNFKGLSKDEVLPYVAYKMMTHTFKNYLGDESPTRAVSRTFGDINAPIIEIGTRAWNDYDQYQKLLQDDYSVGRMQDSTEYKNLMNELVRYLPILGKIYGGWFLGGAEGFNEWDDKRKQEWRNKREGQ